MEHQVPAAIFHLSLPVHDLAETQQFYCSVLGALPGRATGDWIDLVLFGHQVTFHHRPEQVLPPEAQGLQHFGAILTWEDWDALCGAVQASGHPLFMPPTIFGQGTEAEHGKLLLRDPNGYMLEFKTYRNMAFVIPGQHA
jgi:uncharacterized protein